MGIGKCSSHQFESGDNSTVKSVTSYCHPETADNLRIVYRQRSSYTSLLRDSSCRTETRSEGLKVAEIQRTLEAIGYCIKFRKLCAMVAELHHVSVLGYFHVYILSQGLTNCRD